MLEHNTEQRKTLKLKKIFCTPADARQHSLQPKKKKKGGAALSISAPILQGSTSTIGIAISPSSTTKPSSQTDKRRRQQEINQPKYLAPTISQRNKSSNSVSPSPYGNGCSTNLRKKTINEKTNLLPQKAKNNRDPDYLNARRTVATDIRGHYNTVKEQTHYYHPDPKFSTTEEANRRHSCSSVALFASNPGHQQLHRQQQQHNNHSNHYQQPSTPTTPTSKSKFLHRHSEKQQQQRQSDNGNKSFSKLKQWNNKVGTVSSTAAVSLELKPSRSTPLRKVKTYNLPKKLSPAEKEKQRKMQELEDLISGRRSSTLKLSLTPKVLLY